MRLENATWTPERIATLQLLRPGGMQWGMLTQAMNALPGIPVPEYAVRRYCNRTHIVLTPEARQQALSNAGKSTCLQRHGTSPMTVSHAAKAKKAAAKLKANDKIEEMRLRRIALGAIDIPTTPVELPPPGPDGRVEAPLGVWIAWTRQHDYRAPTGDGFDARYTDDFNMWRARRKMPLAVIIG